MLPGNLLAHHTFTRHCDSRRPHRAPIQLDMIAAAPDKSLMHRLTVYPETVKAANRWLDSSAGRSSPFAATIRLADGSGFARSSAWCPGMASEEPQAAQAHAAGTGAHAHASSSVPLPGMPSCHDH